jgi:hypothetical protein
MMEATVALDYRGRKNYLVRLGEQLYYKDAGDGKWYAIKEWETKGLFKEVTSTKEDVDASGIQPDIDAKKAAIATAEIEKTNRIEKALKVYESAKVAQSAAKAEFQASLTPDSERELNSLESQMDGIENLRDYPGDYFPARDKVQAAFKAWGNKYPAALAARRALRKADDAAEQAREDYETANHETDWN